MANLLPKQVDIETSASCNLSCKFCPINGEKERGANRFMTFDLFRAIVDKIPEKSGITVVPWLNGEPLLNPNYSEYIEYVSAKGLRQYVTTNGTIWNNAFFNHILSKQSTVYQIIFSLDGIPSCDSRSIEAARPGSRRYEIISNISSFIKMWKASGKPIDVALKICERGQDYEEIEDYIHYWLFDYGVSYVVVGKPLITENEKPMPYAPCRYSDNNFMVVRHDGRIIPCAYNTHIVNEGAINLGRIETNDPRTLEEIYNSEAYETFRRTNSDGRTIEPCQSCGFAYTGNGWRGKLVNRKSGKEVYYHEDYYNRFFSIMPRNKPDTYYTARSINL